MPIKIDICPCCKTRNKHTTRTGTRCQYCRPCINKKYRAYHKRKMEIINAPKRAKEEAMKAKFITDNKLDLNEVAVFPLGMYGSNGFLIVDKADEQLITDKMKKHKTEYLSRLDTDFCSYATLQLRKNGKFTHLLIHRFLMKPRKNQVVDIINGNGCDCRKANMRVCKKSDDAKNRKLDVRNTSGKTGVAPDGNRYVAYIGSNPRIHLGSFDTLDEAIAARIEAQENKFGKFCRKGV